MSHKVGVSSQAKSFMRHDQILLLVECRYGLRLKSKFPSLMCFFNPTLMTLNVKILVGL